MSNQHDVSRSGAEHRPESNVVLKTVKSQDLFEGERELCIDHKGALYRLKITRQDKLILNK